MVNKKDIIHNEIRKRLAKSIKENVLPRVLITNYVISENDSEKEILGNALSKYPY